MDAVNPNYAYLKDQVQKQRITLLQGSTRSGKTFAIIDYFIHLCMKHKGMEIDITRETYKALKATAWKDFQNRLIEFGLYNPYDHNKSDSIYTLNGNTINYFGSDDHGKVHGKSRDILWVNEAQLADEAVIDQLFPRTRHRIICDFNPALGAEHWLDRYLLEYPPLITTYKDNPHLTSDQVADIESRKENKYWWSIYGEGKRANAEGAVFENWTEGAFEGIDHWYGMDFGYSQDPTALVKVDIDKKGKAIYLQEELYQTGMRTSEIAEVCKRVCGDSLIIADSAEPRLIAELKSKGLNIQGAKKVTIVEGIVLMNDYHMIISGANLKKELSLYRWADKGKSVPVDDNNHILDAARYAVMFKLMKPNHGKYAVG
jgi:phage terminase large subunit